MKPIQKVQTALFAAVPEDILLCMYVWIYVYVYIYVDL